MAAGPGTRRGRQRAGARRPGHRGPATLRRTRDDRHPAPARHRPGHPVGGADRRARRGGGAA
ncbi:hypothetical protein GCE86_13180 [Micromonospora terminaliae]|uniref:Uncharacterized protein n=1 Tax=Micromonospora terminaliae TaxID=1914461 RepID=A0ABX6E197_9ACTN|nr:hypothetical protein GCE86_13180 [Micromonospora terminaliae]